MHATLLVKSITVLQYSELRVQRVFLTIFLSEKIMSQIYEFSTTYQLSYQERLIISKASKERSGIWSKSIPFVAKIEMANARILVQQFTRLVQ